MTQAELTEMAIKAGKGDRDALDAIVWSTRGYILRCCNIFARDFSQDAVQETYESLIRNISKFKNESEFFTWLGALCRNRCISLIRKEHLDRFVSYLPENDNRRIEPKGDDIDDIISMVPKIYRDVIRMTVIEDYSHAECAEELGISYWCENSRYRRGMAWLREHKELIGE